MQIRASNLQGDRPPCPVHPKHPVDHHGTYERYANCNDQTKEQIERFLCRLCGHTISVLPDHFLPYRSVPVRLVEAHFDVRANPGQLSPPATTEKEEGCLKRAWARFKQRVGSLKARLGQMISSVKPSAAQLWNQLRRQSNLGNILRALAKPFNTSLLGDYLCLLPWSELPT